MELESLELANKEMEEILIRLRDEVTRYTTPSLHSIHSDDLICLKKIRQLAEEELKLKNCIKELENKEMTYRRQMNKLLSCKKLQRQKMTETGKNSRLWSPLKNHEHDAYVTKRKYILKDKGRVSRRNVCKSHKIESTILCVSSDLENLLLMCDISDVNRL